MSQPEAKLEPMGVDEFLETIKAVTDHAISGVRDAMKTYQFDLARIAEDSRFRALADDQPYIVKAIVEAEIIRFADEAEAT